MWHLTETGINSPRQVGYTISYPNFEEFCRELLSGFGFSNTVTATP